MKSASTNKPLIVKGKSPTVSNEKIYIIGGIALLVIVAGGYAIYRIRKKKKIEANPNLATPGFGGSSSIVSHKNASGNSSSTSASSGSSNTHTGGAPRRGRFSCSSSSYPLSYGTCHPDVGILQKYLVKSFKANLGNYGRNRDGVDEKFGNATEKAALKHLSKTSFSQKDIQSMKSALKFI